MGTRHEFDRVAGVYLPIAAAVLALVVVTFAVLLWRYRAGSGRAQTSAPSEMPRLEGAWIALIAAVVAVLLVFTLRAGSREDAVASDPALTVRVTAAKWSWRFDYPGGVSLLDRLVVPTGRTVRFDAISLDVLHDLWVPGLRFQRQVWPDHHERFDLVFDRPGTYSGRCAWFCGLDHDAMTFRAQALAPAAFDRWLARARAAA